MLRPVRHAHRPLTHRAATRGAFSMVELIAVIVVIGIVAAVATTSIATASTSRGVVGARSVAADLAYARGRAMATGKRHWVVFSTSGSGSYQVLAETGTGRTTASGVMDPSTQSAMVVSFGSGTLAGVSITSASFGTGTEIGFDLRGRPWVSDSTQLASTGTVQVTQGASAWSVQVEPGTGLARVP